MKKLLAVLLSCAMITAVSVSCGSKNKKNKNQTSSSVSASDSEIIGSWTGDDIMGAVMIFESDGTLNFKADYSDTMGLMHFENNKLILSGMECDTTFDGSKIEASLLGDTIMILERTGEKNDSTMDGEYKLTGGTMFTSMSENPTNDVIINVNGDSIVLTVTIGTYTADGSVLTITGDTQRMFGGADEIGEAAGSGIEHCTYTIDGDTFTLITDSSSENSDGESADNVEIVLKRAAD